MPFTDIALPLVIERSIFRTFSVQNRAMLNPMPAALVALAATVVRMIFCFLTRAHRLQLHNALEEWSAGYYVRKPMKEEFYAPVYRKYCKKLASLQSARPNRFLMMMTSFYGFCV
jgi:Domain of unknown function (DUF6532)